MAPLTAALALEQSTGLGPLARMRNQLIGAAIIAVILPTLIHRAVDFSLSLGSAENTVIGTLIAVVIGLYLLRQLTAYPGVQRFSYVLPSFVAAYGVLVVVFLFLRIDYSRLQLLASFLGAVGWFYVVTNIERQVRRPSLLVIPGGNVRDLLQGSDVDWRLAASPDKVPPGVTGVVADLRAGHSDPWERFLARCALSGLPVYHSKQVSESLTGRVAIEHLSENNLGSLLPSLLYMRLKRLADLLAALAAAPCVAIVWPVVAMLIKLEDGGPVLFRQTRMGFRGETFTMLKFRTMRVGAEADGQPFTDAADTRITRIGGLLRRYRIDELPQIVNILKGEMSWIGPRPESLPLAEWYESRIPFYSYRHIVRPGITGWAQVNQGNVAKVKDATAKLHYDFFYIKHLSPWLELLILAKTVRTVLTGFGAR
jgi:lipopolysaccharide/colanic/teichoic acid biosynthesis glycosyltransferase